MAKAAERRREEDEHLKLVHAGVFIREGIPLA
jgi:hypothetical protein